MVIDDREIDVLRMGDAVLDIGGTRPHTFNVTTGIKSEAFLQREALITAAHAGDARSQFLLAERHRIGDPFTDRDYAEAVRWYRAAAEQGHIEAQSDLGSMYLNGLGVPKDAVQAAVWFRRAAEQGLATAQFNYALRHLHGTGVEQDDEQAVAWLARAAAQGYVEALAELGTLFRFGRGVGQDFVAAADLHVLAAAAGDPVALANLNDYRQDLEYIALGGSASASASLAKMYDRGLGVPQDAATASAWVRWGKACTPDADDSVGKDLERLEFEHIIIDTPEVEAKANALLAEMKRSHVATRRS